MKKRIFVIAILFIAFCTSIVSTSGAWGGAQAAVAKKPEIVILYENDVHCEVNGYAKLSAMKKELKETYEHVGVVSSGDYVQGGSYGLVSRGEYLVDLMNIVGYDAIALGNHEFDYELPRLDELVAEMNTKPICCNFQQIGESESYYDPYTIVQYGDKKIAYIGITTPSTITSSSPLQFKDADGNYLYTFHSDDLYSWVQSYINQAKSEGADYIIALSHLGDKDQHHSVDSLVEQTSGFDVVLDAHAHSVIENRKVLDAQGDEVVISSTGTKFQYVGKLIIADDGITTELISTADYQFEDQAVYDYLTDIVEDTEIKMGRVVGVSEVDLITHDDEGDRLVRNSETNLGDLCADAFRAVTDADIGYFNGGGIRAEIPAGNITLFSLMNVMPFNDHVVVVKMSGQNIKDMLEMTVMAWPNEDGAFPHVSGITFSVNKSIESSVVVDENEDFLFVGGQYRVYNIKVLNKQTGVYEPINLTQTYTVSTTDYFALEGGSGMTMFKNSIVMQNNGMLDVEAFEKYVTQSLGGVIGQQYATVSQNITFTDGEIISNPTSGFNWNIVWIVGAVVLAVGLGAVAFVLIKRKRAVK